MRGLPDFPLCRPLASSPGLPTAAVCCELTTLTQVHAISSVLCTHTETSTIFCVRFPVKSCKPLTFTHALSYTPKCTASPGRWTSPWVCPSHSPNRALLGGGTSRHCSLLRPNPSVPHHYPPPTQTQCPLAVLRTSPCVPALGTSLGGHRLSWI